MNATERVGARIAQVQDRLLEADGRQLARVRARLLAQPPRRVPLGLGVRLALGSVAAALVAALALTLWSPSEEALGFSVAGEGRGALDHQITAGEEPVTLAFTDGSALTLKPGAVVRVVETTAVGARVVLDVGELEVYVKPGQDRRWSIAAGDFEVKVTGTRFGLGWRPSAQRFEIALERGHVEVSGPLLGQRRPVSQGEAVEVDLAAAEVRFRGLEEPSTAVGARPWRRPPGVRGGATPSAPAAADERGGAEESWQELAADGRYVEAMAAVERVGFGALIADADTGALVTLADTARLAGDWRRARVVYLALRERSPESAGATRAAFFLGRIDFDRRGAYHEAARWFQRYLDAGSGGVFAKQASGRLVEAWARADERGRAQDAARRYLERYPRGPHAAFCRGVLAPR